jgi:hypothetical protein
MKHRAASRKKAARKVKSPVKKVRGKRMAAQTMETKIATTKARAKRPVEQPDTRPNPDVLDAMVAGSAEALGLTVDPTWHKSIKFNLQLILQHAALVGEFPLSDDAEPAPVFHA